MYDKQHKISTCLWHCQNWGLRPATWDRSLDTCSLKHATYLFLCGFDFLEPAGHVLMDQRFLLWTIECNECPAAPGAIHGRFLRRLRVSAHKITKIHSCFHIQFYTTSSQVASMVPVSNRNNCYAERIFVLLPLMRIYLFQILGKPAFCLRIYIHVLYCIFYIFGVYMDLSSLDAYNTTLRIGTSYIPTQFKVKRHFVIINNVYGLWKYGRLPIVKLSQQRA